MFFLSPEDESRSPGTGRCCSTALMISNSNFTLKPIVCRSFQVYIKSEVNYHPKPCASERTHSPCHFASLFNFSAKQCVCDAHLRVRENPVNQCQVICIQHYIACKNKGFAKIYARWWLAIQT